MRHILDVLQEVAPVAHFTFWPERTARGTELSCPPILWWTYEKPSQELAEFLQKAISTYRGEIVWELRTTGPRWILQPARVSEYAQTHECAGGLSAAMRLKVEDPGFGERANAEIQHLAEHIAGHLVGRQ